MELPPLTKTQWIQLAIGGLAGAGVAILYALSRARRPLSDAALDRRMARQSLHEEQQAIRVYGQRLTRAEDPRLKQALRHARKEEREHAHAFRQLTGPDMLTLIAKESRSPEEYARRAEAWASTEAKPPSITVITRAYRGAPPVKIARLVREAKQKRIAATQSRWQGYMNEPDDDEE